MVRVSRPGLRADITGAERISGVRFEVRSGCGAVGAVDCSVAACLGGRPRFVQKTSDHSDTLPSCEFLPEEAFFFESYIPSPFAFKGHVSDRTGLLLSVFVPGA